ncbi:TPA: ferredoxin family protein [Pseudomonas putida]|nr:ferredoxin family protein [Pseudomonas putida]
MIELISADRCTGCNICVLVCPTDVFKAVPGQAPLIARQAECQTCFMCEVYCPEDALFVSPLADEQAAVDEQQLTAQGLLGGYREALGWGKGRHSTAALDESYQFIKGI